MAARITLTKMRADLYRIVDGVLDTGIPVEIERHGRVVRLMADKPKSKLDGLVKQPGTIIGDPNDIVHMDWSGEWTEGKSH